MKQRKVIQWQFFLFSNLSCSCCDNLKFKLSAAIKMSLQNISYCFAAIAMYSCDKVVSPKSVGCQNQINDLQPEEVTWVDCRCLSFTLRSRLMVSGAMLKLCLNRWLPWWRKPKRELCNHWRTGGRMWRKRPRTSQTNCRRRWAGLRRPSRSSTAWLYWRTMSFACR